MTLHKDKASSDEEREAIRVVRRRMQHYALHHVGTIGSRTLTALQQLDLFDEPVEEPLGSDIDPEVLRRPENPLREKSPPGRLLLYRTADNPPKRKGTDIPVLLLSSLEEIRTAALAEMERMIESGALEVTPKTRHILNRVRGSVLSGDATVWRPAAIELYDAFEDDVLVALQGVRQSLECEPVLQEVLNRLVPRILRPPVSSLDSINLDVSDPAKEHPRLKSLTSEIAESASTLRDACAQYHARLGYLPLAPAFSMAEVVSKWMDAHPGSDAWGEVWAWARAALGPIPRYHACAVFVLRPDLIPDGKRAELWREVLAVLQSACGDGAEGSAREPWALRRDLTQHYSRHLEANLPGHDGARISCYAWWCAERVAALFPDNPDSARFYRKEWIEDAKSRSAHIWLAASPHIGRSYLRYVTTAARAPWATALLSLMAGKLQQLGAADWPDADKQLLQDVLATSLIEALPFVIEPAAEATYAQEYALGQTALEWAAIQQGDRQQALEQLVNLSRTMDSKDGFADALRIIDERSMPDQIALVMVLKAKAYNDPAIGAAVWGFMDDPAWRQRVLGKLETPILHMVVEALTVIQSNEGDKWFWRLPHFIAELCEKAEDEERTRQLFLFVILASLASDTVSAIRRLLTGPRKEVLAKVFADYRARVEAVWAYYPGWVEGRLRALLASL